MSTESGRIYRDLQRASGPLVVVERVTDVAYGELVEILCGDGTMRRGTVLDISTKRAVIQVFEGAQGLSLRNTSVRFLGKAIEFSVSPALLGRVLTGGGRPLDDMPLPFEGETRSIYGSAINPDRS